MIEVVSKVGSLVLSEIRADLFHMFQGKPAPGVGYPRSTGTRIVRVVGGNLLDRRKTRSGSFGVLLTKHAYTLEFSYNMYRAGTDYSGVVSNLDALRVVYAHLKLGDAATRAR